MVFSDYCFFVGAVPCGCPSVVETPQKGEHKASPPTNFRFQNHQLTNEFRSRFSKSEF